MNPIHDFFRDLFGPFDEGFLSLWTLPSKTSTHVALEELPFAVSEASRLSESGQEVYFGVGVRAGDVGPHKRGKKADVLALPALFLDLDLAGPGHKTKKALPETVEDAIPILEALPDPSTVVASGGGLHAYWILDRPLVLRSKEDRDRAEEVLEKLQLVAIERGASLGYHVDKTADLTRVLRVPGTLNRRHGTPKLVEVLASGGPRYSFEDLARRVSSSGPSPDAGARVAPPAGVGEGSRAIPPPAPGEPEDPIERVKARLSRLRRDANRRFAALFVAGESFADSERDAAMQRAASLLAFVAPDLPAETLAEVLRPSLSKWAAEEGAEKTLDEEMAKALDKCSRALEDARAAREARAAAEEDIRRALIVDARRAGTPAGTDEPPPSEGYTDDEIASFAASQSCTPQEFTRRWIIQRGPSFFVFVDGAYRSPITREELEVSLPRDLAPAPVRLSVSKADGGSRPKKVAEILRDYATVARHLVSDLTIDVSYYDPVTQTFFEAVRPVRRIKPRFHQRIDTWLRLLGGNEADKLLDWIATLTDLRRQTCALYLSKTSGAGKGMLAEGLARLWTDGPPTELARILDNFNADLARCPFIFADEHIASNWRGQRASAELRSLIGSSSRTLTRKHLANAELRGAIRLFLAANNDRMLNLGDEDLGADDLEAVAGRFLHIEVGAAPAAFLRQLGGRSGTDGWVERDLIAEHALWLRDHRHVQPGSRFLVEGRATKMHRTLATQTKVAALATEWIARYLESPTKQVAKTNLVRIGNGEILVNTSALVEHWDVYIRSDDVPTTTRLGRALENLSEGYDRIGNIRFRKIKPDLVLEWAETNHVGDPEEMRKQIDRPLDADEAQLEGLDG